MSSAPVATADVIDQIIGDDPSGRIAALRAQKPELADELQTYYTAIFAPSDRSAEAFPALWRALVAIRVAAHTRSDAAVQWYSRLAEEHGADAALLDRVLALNTPWDDGIKLGAAIDRADLVTLRPADTNAADIRRLTDAGYSPAAILSLSQTIAFVAYQVRLIAGLRALGAAR